MLDLTPLIEIDAGADPHGIKIEPGHDRQFEWTKTTE
jgi:hypothetical protein